jgi:hypothetical protein
MWVKDSNGKRFQISRKDKYLLSKYTFKVYSFSVCRKQYVSACVRIGPKKYKHLALHRAIMQLSDPNKYVDHKDGDGTNNKRSNLRVCSREENLLNRRKRKTAYTSKYKGVSWDQGAFVVTLQRNGVKHYGGRFKDEVLAAKTHDVLAKKYHGEFAYLNFKK